MIYRHATPEVESAIVATERKTSRLTVRKYGIVQTVANDGARVCFCPACTYQTDDRSNRDFRRSDPFAAMVAHVRKHHGDLITRYGE